MSIFLPQCDPRVRYPLVDFDIETGVMRIADSREVIPTWVNPVDGRNMVDLYLLRGGQGIHRALYVDLLFCDMARGRHGRRRIVVHINGVASDDRSANLRWQRVSDE